MAVEPRVDEVLWSVDGQPWQVVGAPYEVRWPLTPGLHRFEASLPWRNERSAAVTVFVTRSGGP